MGVHALPACTQVGSVCACRLEANLLAMFYMCTMHSARCFTTGGVISRPSPLVSKLSNICLAVTSSCSCVVHAWWSCQECMSSSHFTACSGPSFEF